MVIPQGGDKNDAMIHEAATLAEAIDRRMRDVAARLYEAANIIALTLIMLDTSIAESVAGQTKGEWLNDILIIIGAYALAKHTQENP